MNGGAHIAAGVVAASGVVYVAHVGSVNLADPALLPLYGAAAMGALVPDIDHPKSLIGNGIPARLLAAGVGVLIVVSVGAATVARDAGSMSAAILGPPMSAVAPYLPWAWLVIGVGIALLALSFAVSTVVEHRGPTHSLIVGFTLTVLAAVGFGWFAHDWILALYFGLGYLTHLLTDALTPTGCPSLLWPFVRPSDLRSR